MEEQSPRGTYLVLANTLRQGIESGEISDKLPSKSELSKTYGVSFSMIERALAVLKAEGLIVSKQGSASYVAGSTDRRPLVDRMTQLLLREGVQVGDLFPSESELSEQFGASRGAVRTALAQMEGKGLLVMSPKRRRVVGALPQ